MTRHAPRNNYSIPKGYNTTRLILRSLRYFRRNTIKAITLNMEKLGDTGLAITHSFAQ